ncbi:MAG: tRNA (N(6)-L-threonylcarbamoyladenosine(37)-C(2))-methylthiotransferase MtaB [Eubacteriales bacterium]|nr:tRNA (N(6)-L-threonylcarbamoyladenosine(37)-C(2))-methylthiotransferase MtaB [Eubacteriales bacterium]
MKAAFHTLGCKTNHYETDAIAKRFAEAGFERVDFEAAADVYIINTCTVTGEADRKSRQMLRRAKRQAPDSVVVAMGCHAELSDASAYADIVIGTQGKSRALELVQLYLEEKKELNTVPGTILVPSTLSALSSTTSKLAAPLDGDWVYEDFGIVDRQSECRAQIKIEDGCNSFCAYCAIPFARGRIRSRNEDSVLAEATALAKAGYREVVLTGIHVCSYGLDRGEGSDAVVRLANKIAAIEGIERIRLGSLEPLSITPDFIEQARINPKLCPHFHLSLQSGSDSVLQRMNRRYLTKQFREVAVALRTAIPGCSLTTDVIVGFPGESDEEFKESYDFCAEIGFARMHIFRYSPRQGTKAAAMNNQVAAAVSVARSQQLQTLADALSQAFHELHLAQDQLVLVETNHADGYAEGYTPNYVPVQVEAVVPLETNQVYRVKPTHADREFLFATDAKPN